MRYDSQRKVARNRNIVKYKQEHPELSWNEIGAAFGLTGGAASGAYKRTIKSDAMRR